MRELRYKAGGGSGSGHPELEEIAAFLDGRLSEAERASIAEHLSVCEECLELFTETAHSLQETSAGMVEGEVIPFVSRPSSTQRWLPYAAAAVLVVGVGLLSYNARFARPDLTLTELFEPLPRTPALSAAVWNPEPFRGGPSEVSEISVLSFLSGAHLMGYQAAVEAGNSGVASTAAQQIANHFEAADFLEEEARRFREAQFALEDGVSTKRFADLVDETSEAADARFFPAHLDFGKWSQAGYIAARTGNRPWFERRAHRRFLSWVLRQDEEQIDPKAVAALRRIEAVWEREELGAKDFAELAGQFGAILDRYQTLSEQDTLLGEE